MRCGHDYVRHCVSIVVVLPVDDEWGVVRCDLVCETGAAEAALMVFFSARL